METKLSLLGLVLISIVLVAGCSKEAVVDNKQSQSKEKVFVYENRTVSLFKSCKLRENVVEKEDLYKDIKTDNPYLKLKDINYLNATIEREGLYSINFDDLEPLSEKYNLPIVCGPYLNKSYISSNSVKDFYMNDVSELVLVSQDNRGKTIHECKNLIYPNEYREDLPMGDAIVAFYCCAGNYCTDLGKVEIQQYLDCECENNIIREKFEITGDKKEFRCDC